MHRLFDAIERFARTDVTVTFLGETGAGKVVAARALHERSARAGAPFVVFDCGAVTASLAESELLGHERGAFTGAIAAHSGAFERAHGGTLFLDEIAELPLDLQPRLLRALESRKIRRVGGNQERRVDVRVVAATNRDLRACVSSGRFREDLFFRLAVAVVPVPALRDRLDDLPILVQNLLTDLGRQEVRLAEGTIDALGAHAWPGNVRELKNALACALAYLDAGCDRLTPRHFRSFGAESSNDFGPTRLPRGRNHECPVERLPLGGQPLDRIERAAIRQTLRQTTNKTDAARTLGIAVSTLYEKLKKHGLSDSAK